MDYAFTEQQKFRQPWLVIVLIVLMLFLIRHTYLDIHYHAYGTMYTWLIPDVVSLIIIFFVFSIKLKTRIDASGIYYQFSPLHLKENKIDWNNVAHIYVRKYRPMLEFGGWGMRYSFANGRAYNISGNMGIQIELINKKKILIGTRQPQHAEQVLAQLSKEKGIDIKDREQISAKDRF